MESVEEFLARGGKIEHVPIRSGDEILEHMRKETLKYNNTSMKKAKEDKGA